MRRSYILPLGKHDSFVRVVLFEHDANLLLGGVRHVLSHEVSADRQLPVASVDEDGELDALRTPHVDQSVARRADRPARVEYIVDEHDGLSTISRSFMSSVLRRVHLEEDGVDDGRDADTAGGEKSAC